MFKGKGLKIVLASILMGFFVLSPVSPFVQIAKADSVLCQVFPFIRTIGAFGVSSICEGGANVATPASIANQGANLVRAGVSLIFVGIVIVAVYIVIKAAVKYIRSEGDETKIQESQKAIKSVFLGLVALFIGIIGLVLILVIFNAVDAVESNTVPIDSAINRSCESGGVADSNGTCPQP